MQEILDKITRLTGFSAADQALLKSVSPQALAWSDELIARFYDLLYSDPTTTALLGENDRSAREQTLGHWYKSIFEGELSPRFWQQQWVVGLVHILRRISNVYMLGMMSVAQQFFLEKCLAEWDAARAREVYGAFKRATDTIAALIAEAYFLNYIQAMEQVAGFRMNLIERMMDMEVRNMLEEARKAA